jgi:ligand-binding SRPBCC domain-containing protein
MALTMRALLSAAAEPPRRREVLHRESVVAAPLDETFAFFADARNLERLTPAWLNFSIRTSRSIEMREGAEIEYRIRLYGVPIPWISRIDAWVPNARFVDRQLVGPYRWWHHDHLFTAAAHGTRVVDHIEYVPRAAAVSRGLVGRDLRRIFDYRAAALQRIFGEPGH